VRLIEILCFGSLVLLCGGDVSVWDGKQWIRASTSGRSGGVTREHAFSRIYTRAELLRSRSARLHVQRKSRHSPTKQYLSPKVCSAIVAQPRTRNPQMAENSLNHLNYGHAGAAAFDLENQEWSFARSSATTTLKQIGAFHKGKATSNEVVPASIHFPSTAVSTRTTDANTHAKDLLHAYPELVPAAELLSELVVTSAAIVSTTATYDPLVGDLFSLGTATFEDLWANPRRICATVTGEAGNVLRLALLYKETQGWGSDKSVWLRGSTLRDTESGYWNEEAAPIQHVCFAESEDRSKFLAVRLPTRTVIFRPLYTQRPQPSYSPHYEFPPSLVDAHPILSLSMDQSGGSPHVDVAFNPDFQLQFAVVDQNQTWSVWDIERGRKSETYKLSCSVHGQIPPPEDAKVSEEDGWARILWVGDVTTILVCNRRQLSIIDIRGSASDYFSYPPVISSRSSDWILDVRRHPLLKRRVFVLTSTVLVLIEVTTPSEVLDGATDEAGASVLLSWNHYRGAEDLTLKISVQMLAENGKLE
jgi:RNA polymerase I-specific transcription initiation factor RRN6